MTSENKAVTLLKEHPAIQGISPLTGFPVHFIAFKPAPGRSKVLVIIHDNWYYSTDAGNTWQVNPTTIDIRQVDLVINW